MELVEYFKRFNEIIFVSNPKASSEDMCATMFPLLILLVSCNYYLLYILERRSSCNMHFHFLHRNISGSD